MERLIGESSGQRPFKLLAQGAVDGQHGAFIVAAHQQVLNGACIQNMPHSQEVGNHRLAGSQRSTVGGAIDKCQPSVVKHDVVPGKNRCCTRRQGLVLFAGAGLAGCCRGGVGAVQGGQG